MFGKGVHQEEEALLREILRTIDRKSITVPVKAKERVLACILQRAATMQLYRSISRILKLLCEI